MTDAHESDRPKSLTVWWLVVVVLLLCAAAVPVVVKIAGPKTLRLDVTGDPGGTIKWRGFVGGAERSGVTNLPVSFEYLTSQMEFSIERTNYNGPIRMEGFREGNPMGSVGVGAPSKGVEFSYSVMRWGFSSMP